MAEYVEVVWDLEVYKKAQHISQQVFELSKTFPSEERYSLVDQMRRASRSVGAQIAEAWGKRRYPRHFSAKLTDADAERLETEHWVRTAFLCKYISASTSVSLASELAEVGNMLNRMIHKADDFSIQKK